MKREFHLPGLDCMGLLRVKPQLKGNLKFSLTKFSKGFKKRFRFLGRSNLISRESRATVFPLQLSKICCLTSQARYNWIWREKGARLSKKERRWVRFCQTYWKKTDNSRRNSTCKIKGKAFHLSQKLLRVKPQRFNRFWRSYRAKETLIRAVSQRSNCWILSRLYRSIRAKYSRQLCLISTPLSNLARAIQISWRDYRVEIQT